MTDLEKLLEDYSQDMYNIAQQMYSWCEPTKEVLDKIKTFKRKAIKLNKKEKKHGKV